MGGWNVRRKGRWAEVRPWRFLADLDGGVGGEFVGRDGEVARRRTLADARGRIVDRTVARAEPALIGAAVIARLVAERDAAEMRADADDDEPFRFFDPVGILLRVAQCRHIDILGGLDLLGRTVIDEDRLAAPGDCEALA